MTINKVVTDKVFWSIITAGFAFSALLFNISMASMDTNVESTHNAIEANREAIQITNTDIKQILIDTSYIRGIVKQHSGN